MQREQKLKIFFATITVGCGLFFALGNQEASAANLNIKGLETEQTLDIKTTSTWQGNFSISSEPQLEAPNNSLADLLNQFTLGKEPPKPSKQVLGYDPKEVYAYLVKLSADSSNTTEEPKLVITDGRATEFNPPRSGLTLDAYNSTLAVIDALKQNNSEVTLKLIKLEPKTKLSDLNDLGINELIGRGESNFAGSPNNRRHNISVGLTKFKGVIIAPGQEFSFNKYLGPVEASEGFLPELVIKRTGTVPELGGGLCQVSTTTFRAAIKAGLPITARKNHAYAVKYYAPQGTDATIYPGSADLKFINDTPGSILIWPYLKDSNNLVFDFYGTKDDRQVVIDTPVQYDKKSDGSMKATWSIHVTKNGLTKDQVFKSIYQPPALFHKEEQFVPATPPVIPTEPTSPPVTQTTPQTPTQTQ